MPISNILQNYDSGFLTEYCASVTQLNQNLSICNALAAWSLLNPSLQDGAADIFMDISVTTQFWLAFCTFPNHPKVVPKHTVAFAHTWLRSHWIYAHASRLQDLKLLLTP